MSCGTSWLLQRNLSSWLTVYLCQQKRGHNFRSKVDVTHGLKECLSSSHNHYVSEATSKLDRVTTTMDFAKRLIGGDSGACGFVGT